MAPSPRPSTLCEVIHPPGGQRLNTGSPLEDCEVGHPGGGQDHNERGGDRAVAEIARRQHGVVSHGQLLAAGLTRRSIERRAQSGRLHRVHRGVYAVGHMAPIPLLRETAALLACGDGAVLSHRSAGAAWGILDRPATVVEVTVVGPDCGGRPGVRVRRARRIASEDVALRDGLRLTAPARTLLDLASVLSARALRRAANEALVLGLADEDALWAMLDRCRGRRGAPQLRRLLTDGRGPSLTRSEAERRLLELIASADLPRPETNVRVGRYEVDFLWREQRLVAEVDGYAFHGTRAAFERDRIRDAEFQACGYAVLRITWRQIVEAPNATIARIARTVGHRTAGHQPTFVVPTTS